MADGMLSQFPRAVNDHFEHRRDYPHDSPGLEPGETDDRANGHRPRLDPLAELERLIGYPDPFAAQAQRGNPGGPSASHPGDFDARRRAADEYPEEISGQERGHEDRMRDFDRQFRRNPAREHFPQTGEHEGEVEAESYDADAEQGAAHMGPLGGAYPRSEDAGDYPEADGYDERGYRWDAEASEEEYEELGASRRRHAVKVAAAVLGLAVFGSAAAMGYRAIFKGGVQGPPPVIRADNSPTKVVPAGTSAESSSKSINERLGGESKERLVQREEEPVELRDPARAPKADPATPFSTFGASTPFASAAPAAPAPSAGRTTPSTTGSVPTGGSLTEPKRVRTVSIRADQPGSVPAAPRAGSTTRPASGPPLALTPQSVGAVAQAAPESPAVAHPRATRTAENGSFMVQLSAQKSEAEAEASFRSMQARYVVLSGRQPSIRRKDQGQRGIFYVAQVGPFGSRDEAVGVCEQLKSAGGACFVEKN